MRLDNVGSAIGTASVVLGLTGGAFWFQGRAPAPPKSAAAARPGQNLAVGPSAGVDAPDAEGLAAARPVVKLLRDAIAPASDDRSLVQAAVALRRYLCWKVGPKQAAELDAIDALDLLIATLPENLQAQIGSHEGHVHRRRITEEDAARAVLRSYTMPEIAATTDLQRFRARLLQRFSMGRDDATDIAWLAVQAKGSVQFVIATLPDYVDSQVRRYFDQELGGIAEAASARGYTLDRFHLPEWAGAAPVADGLPRRHEIEPGAVIFKSTANGRSQWLVVLIALETPTAGLHVRAFTSATALVMKWRETAPQKGDLRILGPAFSGTAPSLKDAICSIPLPGGVGVTMISGAASNGRNQDLFSACPSRNGVNAGAAITFHATVRDNDDIQRALYDQLVSMNRQWTWGSRVALLIESNTAYGQDFDDDKAPEPVDGSSLTVKARRPIDIWKDANGACDPYRNGSNRGVRVQPRSDRWSIHAATRADGDAFEECRKQLDPRTCAKGGPCVERDFVDGVKLRFPLHISRVRTAAAAAQASLAPIFPGLSGLHVDLQESVSVTDQLPSLTPELTAVGAERAMDVILRRLRSEGVTAVGVYATDTRDFLFLARAIREAMPDVQLFGTGADLLFVTRDFAPYMRGAILASTYLLHSDTQLVTRPARGRIDRHQFQTMEQQGTYNAAVMLFGETAGPDDRTPSNAAPALPLALPEVAASYLLTDYSPPMIANGKECEVVEEAAPGSTATPVTKCLPPVWIGIVGNDAIWPVRAAVSNSAYVRPAPDLKKRDTDWKRDAAPRASAWAGLCLLGLLTIAMLHAGGLFYVWWHDDSHVRKGFQSRDDVPSNDSPTDTARTPAGRLSLARDYVDQTWSVFDKKLETTFDWRRTRWLWLLYPPSRTRHFGKEEIDAVVKASGGRTARRIVYATHDDTLRADRAHFGYMVLLLTSLGLMVSACCRTAWLWATPHDLLIEPLRLAWLLTLAGLGATALGSVIEFIRPGALLRGKAPQSPGTPVQFSSPAFWSVMIALALGAFELRAAVWQDSPGWVPAPLVTFGRWIDVTNGVSPLAVYLFLCGALYLWSVWNLRRLKMQSYPRTPNIDVLFRLMNGDDRVFAVRCQRAWDEFASWADVRSLWVLLPAIAGIATAWPGWRNGYTIDGSAFTWLFWFASVAGVVCMADAVARAAYQGQILSEQLFRLGQHPVADVFSKVAKLPFDWRLTLFQQSRLALAPLVDEIHMLRASSPTSGTDAAHTRELAAALAPYESGAPRLADLEDPTQPLITTSEWRASLEVTRVLVAILTAQYWSYEARLARLEDARKRAEKKVEGAQAQEGKAGGSKGESHLSMTAAEPLSYYERAEVIVGLQVAYVVRNLLARIVSGLSASLVGFGLLLTGHLLYSFQGRNFWLSLDLAGVCLAAGIACMTLIRLERDRVLSALWSTTPGRINWTGGFMQRIATYVALPSLAVLAALFPEVGDTLLGWLAPVKQLLGP